MDKLMNTALKCEMATDCKEAVTHIDNKGFIYCRQHGIECKGWRPCRMLKPGELKRLKAGIPVVRY